MKSRTARRYQRSGPRLAGKADCSREKKAKVSVSEGSEATVADMFVGGKGAERTGGVESGNLCGG